MKSTPTFMLLSSIVIAGCATQHGEGENLGRTIGGELGRAAAGGVFSPVARIGGVLGETAGKMAGRTLDSRSSIERAEQQAREQAARDAAYEAERKRLDPWYVLGRGRQGPY